MPQTSQISIPFTLPMECLPVARLPEGAEWIYELKLDGYRAQAIRDSKGVRVLSRNGKDLTKKYPQLVKGLNETIAADTALDGELVAFDDAGLPSFNALQNATRETNVVFFAFDVLVSEGKEVKMLPLRARKEVLSRILQTNGHVQLSEHFGGPLAKFIEGVKKIGGEGVVAKRLDAPYQSGRRSGSWSKKRINIGQEFVIGGFTLGSNGIDALVVGYYEGGKLIYAARVRAGLVPASRRELYDLLKPNIVKDCPFGNLPEAKSGRWGQGLTAAKMKECIWVEPRLVANFEFLEWTDSNHVRHIKFVALRSDKDPLSVVRE
jgi:DNA ligase D-like protein (predicted ligase)